MFRRRQIGLLLGAILWASSASAQEQKAPVIEITFEGALSLARAQAPTLLTAKAQIKEAESQIDAAEVWRFNPRVAASAGPRFGKNPTVADWSVGFQQWFEIGGQGGDRVDVAQAGVDAGRARHENIHRQLLRSVTLAFVSALYWQRRVELAEENVRLAVGLERVARRRHELGDVGGLDESVAALALVRARIGEEQARAALGQAAGQLKMLLGVDAKTELVPKGDLRQMGMPTSESAESISDVSQRSDLKALRADIRQAEAQAELGRANRVPNFALGAGYSREESDNIVRGTLTLSLPVFDHGQGATAVAQARQQRLGAELHAVKSSASVEIDTADSTAQRLSDAARRFEEAGLATLERAEHLVTASYESGAIPLGELLAVRRELVQAKLDYTGLLLGAAEARAELAASTGLQQ